MQTIPNFTGEGALSLRPAVLSGNVDLAADDIDNAIQVHERRGNNDLYNSIVY
jgi:hypothetical protein